MYVKKSKSVVRLNPDIGLNESTVMPAALTILDSSPTKLLIKGKNLWFNARAYIICCWWSSYKAVFMLSISTNAQVAKNVEEAHMQQKKLNAGVHRTKFMKLKNRESHCLLRLEHG